MKKLIATLIIVVLLVVTIMVTPSAVKADDCRGNSCVVATPQCGEIGPSGLRLCARETTVSQSDNKGTGQGTWSGRKSFTTIQAPAPKPTGYQPQLFHKRDCIKMLSCLVLYGNGKDQ